LEQKEKMNQNDRYVLRKQHEFFSFKYSIIWEVSNRLSACINYLGSEKIVEKSTSANSQPNESTNDIHIGKNIFNLPANDPVEPKEKMNQNDR
jgi:hypothetical protein